MGVWEGYFVTANIAIRYVLIFPMLDSNACKTIVSYIEDKSLHEYVRLLHEVINRAAVDRTSIVNPIINVIIISYHALFSKFKRLSLEGRNGLKVYKMVYKMIFKPDIVI